MAAEAVRMHGSAPVTNLVMRARNDNKQAWDALAERYAPLVWSVCPRYGLSDAYAADIGQITALIRADAGSAKGKTHEASTPHRILRRSW